MAFVMSGIALGALVGGGMAALQNKDIGKGALYGGLTGAVTGGIGSLGASAATSAGEDALASGLMEQGVVPAGWDTLAGDAIGNSAMSSGVSSSLAASPESQMGAGFGTSGVGAPSSVAPSPYTPASSSPFDSIPKGIQSLTSDPMQYLKDHAFSLGAAGLAGSFAPSQQTNSQTNPGSINPFTYSQTPNPSYTGAGTRPFNQSYTALPQQSLASGGIAGLESNQAYPMSQQDHTQYSSPSQLPASAAVINSDYDAQTDPYTGTEVVQRMASGGVSQAVTDYNNMLAQRAQQEYVNSPPPNALLPPSMRQQTPTYSQHFSSPAAQAVAPTMPSTPQDYQQMPMDSFAQGNGGAANGGLMASGGGISSLGGYSDGGQLLRGPGNGTSDDIPATIGGKQPARLASGEFVVPSRIVSELGNGSTEAGAKELYGMMNRIQRARAKTVGKDKVAFDAKARHQLPA